MPFPSGVTACHRRKHGKGAAKYVSYETISILALYVPALACSVLDFRFALKKAFPAVGPKIQIIP
jgi:hypothetical protein